MEEVPSEARRLRYVRNAESEITGSRTDDVRKSEQFYLFRLDGLTARLNYLDVRATAFPVFYIRKAPRSMSISPPCWGQLSPLDHFLF
jgi:hypothetical protein